MQRTFNGADRDPRVVPSGAEPGGEDHPRRRITGRRRPSAPEQAPAAELPFELGSLAAVRALVAGHCRRAGLTAERREDLVLAVDELACNSVRHGGGRGILRIWREPGELVCEVSDEGLRTVRPRARAAAPDAPGGRGLWMAERLCDGVEYADGPLGGALRVRMRLSSPGASARPPRA